MGEVHIQNHHQESILLQNSPTLHKQKQHSKSFLDQQEKSTALHKQKQQKSFLDQQETKNTDFFSKLQLNSTSSTDHRHKTSTKRRSPASSSSERRPKKHSFDQDDLTNNGFSAISLPFSVCGNDLHRCVSTPEQSTTPPEQSTLPPVKGSGLPPLPQNLRRCLSADVSGSLNTEETTAADSLRLKRMKDRLREMRQWWDEIMKEEEEEEVVEEEQEEKEQSPYAKEENVLYPQLQITKPQSPVAEEYKAPSQDEYCDDFEEAVSVEWAEKCLSLTFKCPCGKGYEVLISANNCYYKLV